MRSESVSVVIPTYNRAHLVARAIDSVRAQIREGDEIIVVDDGSTDHTREVLAGYGDAIVVVQGEQGGAGVARNRGIERARHPLIAFLDSDDEWMAGSLELRRRIMEAWPDVVLCFSDMAITDPEGAAHRHYLASWHNDPRPWDAILPTKSSTGRLFALAEGLPDVPVHRGDLFADYAERPYIFTGTVITRRALARHGLAFATDLSTYEDWVAFGNLVRAGPVAYLDHETAWQHAHAGPRLTDAECGTCAEVRLAVLERVWAAAPAYVAAHRDRLEAVIHDQQLIRTRAYLGSGRRAEARAALRAAGGGPLHYELLARLPGPVLRALMGVRHLLRGSASADSV